MKKIAHIFALILIMALTGAANAQVQLTDVVTFGADASGSWQFQPDSWDTEPGGNWDNWLQSLPTGIFLNGPSDAAVRPNITLVTGTNSFRIYASPGVDNANFGINLFFSGAATPAISAFGPMLTSANQVNSFAADNASFTPATVPVYNSGIPGAGTLAFETSNQVITLTDFYLATPLVFNLDQASQTSLGSDGVLDYVGGFTLVVSNKNSASDCTPPPAGIVGWWKGDGTAVDMVAGNNGTLLSAGYTNGVDGLAFAFDPENYPYGTHTGVQIADSPAYVLTNALTIEGWVRPRGDGYFIFFRGDHRPGTDPYWLAMTGNNILEFLISDENGNSASVTTPLVYGAWVHLAATYDGSTGTMKLYTNGVLAAQTVTSVHPFGLLAADQSPGVGIGNLNDGGNNFPFHGDIDEVALYNRALTTNEITAIYNAGSAGKCASSDCTPPPAGLVAWWPGEGNAHDIAGTNNGAAQNINFLSGQVGQAFVFDGSSCYVQVPAAPSLNVGVLGGFTIEGWINPQTTTPQLPMIEWNNGSTFYGWGTHFWMSGGDGGNLTPGSLYANLKDTGGQDHQIFSSPSLVVTNQFQHVALTYDKSSGMGTIYLNGVVVAQQNLGIFTPQTSYDLYLGYRPGADYWSGLLDEFSIYSRALSINEIAAIYNAGSAGKCTSGAFILQQPVNQTTVAGSGASLTVGLGGIGPFTYQWRFNGTNISGATNATFTLTNLHGNQSGHYSVVITTPDGTLTSADAIVTVIPQDILIYNYSGKEQITTFSQDLAYNYSGQMLLIPAGTNGTFVGWANINGKKQYWVSPLTGYLWITIARKNSHNYTVLGLAGDGIDTNGYPHLWSSLHRGVNTQLAIAKKRTFSFPNIFSSIDNHIYPDTNTGNLILVDASSTYQFAPANTQSANNAGQTLPDLIKVLTKSLEKQGYQK